MKDEFKKLRADASKETNALKQEYEKKQIELGKQSEAFEAEVNAKRMVIQTIIEKLREAQVGILCKIYKKINV
jgi:hypothetical protein